MNTVFPLPHHVGIVCPDTETRRVKDHLRAIGFEAPIDTPNGMYFDQTVEERAIRECIRLELVKGDMFAAGNLSLPVISSPDKLCIYVDDLSAAKIFGEGFGLKFQGEGRAEITGKKTLEYVSMTWKGKAGIRFMKAGEDHVPTNSHLGFFFEDIEEAECFARQCNDDFVRQTTLDALAMNGSIKKVEVSKYLALELLIGDEALHSHGGLQQAHRPPALKHHRRHGQTMGGFPTTH